MYALTEAVAPPELLRESDPDVADDYLMTKLVGADGLAPMRTVGNFMRRKVTPAEMVAWRQRKLDAGELIEVRVEGWRAPQVAVAADEPLIRDLLDGRTPSTWQPLGPTTEEEATFLAPLDPVSARGRATSLFGFEYIWEIYKPVEQRRWGAYTLPVLWGDRLVARFDARMDRSTATVVVNGMWLEDEALATDDVGFPADAAGFLEAGAIEAALLHLGPCDRPSRFGQPSARVMRWTLRRPALPVQGDTRPPAGIWPGSRGRL